MSKPTIFDKALQNPSQVALLSEATCAACIILKTDILPSMLVGLSDPDPEVAENTLDGLRQVMSIKSRVVLPYLVPQLTAPPVNTKVLSILVSVAVEALTKYLSKILCALLQALAEAQGTLNESQELEYCQTVILSVSDEVGIRYGYFDDLR
ncbi:stalled ribosome sensor GCN1-like [Glossina fuscipes fuscipes]